MNLEIQAFKHDLILTDIRSALYKKICIEKGSLKEWKFIIGVESAKNVQLKQETIDYLNNVVDYLNTEEGKVETEEMGLSLEHYDDLIELVRDSKNKRQLKNEEFKIIMKNRKRVTKYLIR